MNGPLTKLLEALGVDRRDFEAGAERAKREMLARAKRMERAQADFRENKCRS